MNEKITFGWLIILSIGVVIAWAIPFVKDFLEEYWRIK